MGNLISVQDIEKAKANFNTVRQAANQVIKDFASFGIDIQFPENLQLAYEELFEQVNEYIHDLLINNPEKLMSLLYRIDLSESSMKTAQKALNKETTSIIISELILHREMQKVLIRNYFSGRDQK